MICKTRTPGPAFMEMDEEEIRMQKMMASMKVSGRREFAGNRCAQAGGHDALRQAVRPASVRQCPRASSQPRVEGTSIVMMT